MTWKVGVTVRQGPKGDKVTLWTLDNTTNEIKQFETKEDADEYGERCWPNQWTTKEILGPEDTNLAKEARDEEAT